MFSAQPPLRFTSAPLCASTGRLHQRYSTSAFPHGLLELRTRGPCGAALARSRTARQVDLSGRVVVFESLKKRRRGVFRAVPVPPELLDTLDMVHGIREAQRRGQVQALLWPWSRMTGFRRVQEVIRGRRHPGRPPRLPQGPAARLRGAGRQPGHRAE